LFKKFQSDFDFIFSTTPYLKKINQTMLKNFQSIPQPLLENHSQINQTLLENKKMRSVSDYFNRKGEKPVITSDVNPLPHLTKTVPPATQPNQPNPAQKF